MDTLKQKALALLSWGWDKLVAFVKWAWSWVVTFGNTLYDPPPVAYKRLFFTALAIFVAGGLSFAFVHSWFYKPTAAFFASLEDSSTPLYLPEALPAPLPVPPVTVTELPPPVVSVPVFEDASDTPHKIEPVKVEKPKLPYQTKKKVNRKRVRAVKFQTYWGF